MSIDKSSIDLTNPQLVSVLNECFTGQKNMFVQARAGCGKSTIIKMIMKNLKNVIVLSTTGSSASDLSSDNVPAYTIHSFLKIPPTPVYTADDLKYISKNNLKVLKKAKIIIIDEVSMMTNQLFDFMILKIGNLLNVKNSDAVLPRFILFGDILQLPPVINKSDPILIKYYQDRYNGNVMFFNSEAYKTLKFDVHTLTKSYRQKDEQFSTAIQRISVGDIDQNLLNYFNKRVLPETEFAKSFNTYMYLSVANATVNNRNQEYINSLPGDSVIFETINSGVDPKKVPKNVEIKIGCQVMITCNGYGQSEDRCFSNGMCGEVIGIKKDSYLDSCEVEVDVPKHGLKTIKYITYEEREPIIDEFGNVGSVITGTYRTMPCVACKAITVHKSQGKTLNASYINLGNWVPEALTYVALSRAESLESIGLSRPLTFKDFKINQESKNFILNRSAVNFHLGD